ncbi:hypothetical protein D9M72_451710 [compost metagenome]
MAPQPVGNPHSNVLPERQRSQQHQQRAADHEMHGQPVAHDQRGGIEVVAGTGGRQVAAVLAQPCHRAAAGFGGIGHRGMDAPRRLALQRVIGVGGGLDRACAAAQAAGHEQADEEGAEVAAAADGGQVVELRQQRGQARHGLRRGGAGGRRRRGFRRGGRRCRLGGHHGARHRLHHPQAEGGAADAAAGQRQGPVALPVAGPRRNAELAAALGDAGGLVAGSAGSVVFRGHARPPGSSRSAPSIGGGAPPLASPRCIRAGSRPSRWR